MAGSFRLRCDGKKRANRAQSSKLKPSSGEKSGRIDETRQQLWLRQRQNFTWLALSFALCEGHRVGFAPRLANGKR